MRRRYPTSFRDRRLDTLYWDLVGAATENSPRKIDAVLNRGAHINRTNERGETAFSFACARNCLAAARRLHARGANVNTIDTGGGSPLDWAVCWASYEFRQWLIGVGGRRHDDTYEPAPWPRPTPNIVNADGTVIEIITVCTLPEGDAREPEAR